MSNPYRKLAPDQESRLDRLLEARMIIEAEAALGGQRGQTVQARLISHYEEHGGFEIDSQIEGLMLVIEEGKLYRKAALKHAAQLNPPALEKAPISAATMVSASRQLERLADRREYIKEEAELNIALSLTMHQQLIMARKQKPAEQPAQTEAKQHTPKAAPDFREEKGTTPGQRAASAAA